jgi:hypothetical protein
MSDNNKFKLPIADDNNNLIENADSEFAYKEYNRFGNLLNFIVPSSAKVSKNLKLASTSEIAKTLKMDTGYILKEKTGTNDEGKDYVYLVRNTHSATYITTFDQQILMNLIAFYFERGDKTKYSVTVSVADFVERMYGHRNYGGKTLVNLRNSLGKLQGVHIYAFNIIPSKNIENSKSKYAGDIFLNLLTTAEITNGQIYVQFHHVLIEQFIDITKDYIKMDVYYYNKLKNDYSKIIYRYLRGIVDIENKSEYVFNIFNFMDEINPSYDKNKPGAKIYDSIKNSLEELKSLNFIKEYNYSQDTLRIVINLILFQDEYGLIYKILDKDFLLKNLVISGSTYTNELEKWLFNYNIQIISKLYQQAYAEVLFYYYDLFKRKQENGFEYFKLSKAIEENNMPEYANVQIGKRIGSALKQNKDYIDLDIRVIEFIRTNRNGKYFSEI